MSRPTFLRMLDAPRKEYNERGVKLPYADYRVLLGALAHRPRPDDVVLAWDLDNGGTKASLHLKRPHHHIWIPLSVPDMIELARTDRQALYDYLNTCTELLRCRRLFASQQT